MAENILIEGSVAVVTGGASGIGKGITKALLNNGATVVVADIEEKPINDTLNEFSDLGSVDGFVTDVASEESVENLSTYVYKTYGKCNLLFNNAGVGSGGGGKAWQNEPNDWKWCFSVNVFGPAHGVISFVPKMIASGEPGHIINTSSVFDPKESGIGHLIGLMFHRAWSLKDISAKLDRRRDKVLFKKIAKKHSAEGYDLMFKSGYGGEHWLATFAIYNFAK